MRINFKVPNIQAKYEALYAKLRFTQELGTIHLAMYSDSQLRIKQENDDFKGN